MLIDLLVGPSPRPDHQTGLRLADHGGRWTRRPITIVLADDHELFRELMRLVLDRLLDLEVVGAGADGGEAVALTERLRPDILLLDDDMPDIDGLGVTLAVRAAVPRTRIVILTGWTDQRRAELLLRMGVDGYLSKATSMLRLTDTLRLVHRGEHVFDLPDSGAGRDEGPSPSPDDPTPRELDVLHLLADGLRNREIASRLCISEHTVEFHLGNMMAKLQASSRLQLVNLAWDAGWLV
jgi:DNA-binding NarL/FixJ family response regulator